MTDFHIDQQAMRRGFQRAVGTYATAAVLPQEIIMRAMERLSYITCNPKTVVDLGSGTGFAIPLLQARFPTATVISVDHVPSMLQEDENEVAICADAHQLPFATQSVDLIFANFVLPYLNNMSAVFREWARVLKPGGLLMFSTLGPDSLYELRSAWDEVTSQLRVHAFYDMHDIGDVLLKNQFSGPVIDAEQITLTYRNADALFRDLKAQGAMNVLRDRPRGLTTPRMLSRVKAAYEKFRQADILPATFEVINGHAWGASLTAGVDASGNVRIPIDRINRHN